MTAAAFFAYEDLTVSTVAVPFTAATRGTANVAHVEVENAIVRFKFGTPTATSGNTLYPGDSLDLETKSEVESIYFISRDGASATVRCSFGVA